MTGLRVGARAEAREAFGSVGGELGVALGVGSFGKPDRVLVDVDADSAEREGNRGRGTWRLLGLVLEARESGTRRVSAEPLTRGRIGALARFAT